MSFEELKIDLGQALTPKQVAELLRVDVRTVKQYADELGGVRVGPRLIRFFENSLRRSIYANKDKTQGKAAVARTGEAERKDCGNQVVRHNTERPGECRGVGSNDQKTASVDGQNDPHGLSYSLAMGNKIS